MVNFPDLDTSDDDIDVQVDAARFEYFEVECVFPSSGDEAPQVGCQSRELWL